MNYTVITYLAYLGITVPLTVWVAQTLFKNGRLFLVDSFHGNQALADSVNQLLLVGFYLINIGYVALALRFAAGSEDVQQVLEAVSLKVGVVMVILGLMHFLNLYVFTRLRRRALNHQTPPPIPVATLLRQGLDR
jgi:hypothetical protein